MMQTITLEPREDAGSAVTIEVALTSEMHAIMDSNTIVHGNGPSPESIERLHHRHVYRLLPAADTAYTFETTVCGGDSNYKVGQAVVGMVDGRPFYEESMMCKTESAHNYNRTASSGLQIS